MKLSKKKGNNVSHDAHATITDNLRLTIISYKRSESS